MIDLNMIHMLEAKYHARVTQFFVRVYDGKWKREHEGEANHDQYIAREVEVELRKFLFEHPEVQKPEVCMGGRRWNQL